VRRTAVWRGLDEPRMEIARVHAGADGVLLDGGEPRDYMMRFVSVPDLQVSDSMQRYEPLGGRRLRYRSGTFAADIEFDDDGVVVRYEGLAERVG
jgi:hypothetical protein